MAFGFVSAQENVVKVNPLLIVDGTDLVSFEHKLGENLSFVVGAGIGRFKIGYAKYSNFGGEVQYRYYFNEALRGFYAGGQARYLAGKVETENSFPFDEQGNMNSFTNETNFGPFKVGA